MLMTANTSSPGEKDVQVSDINTRTWDSTSNGAKSHFFSSPDAKLELALHFSLLFLLTLSKHAVLRFGRRNQKGLVGRDWIARENEK